MVQYSTRKKLISNILLLCGFLASFANCTNLTTFADQDKIVFDNNGAVTLKDMDQAFYGLTKLMARHIALMQDGNDDEYANDVEKKFALTNSFLAGFKTEESFPSAVNCSKFLEQSIYVYNDTMQEWKENNETGTKEYIFDTTYWISYSLGPSSRYCFMVGLEGWWWYVSKTYIYEGFIDGFLAWLSNLLGNVITFNALYKKITEADEAKNEREMFYWYGRLCTLILNFDPIPEDDLDFERLEPEEITELISTLGVAYGALKIPQKQREFTSAINDYSQGMNGAQVMSPRVDGTWDDMYGFSAGLIQSSFGDASPNSSVCQTNITRIVEKSISFVEQLRIHTNVTLNQSAESFEHILGSIYPITFSCYYSMYEYVEVAKEYGTTLTDGYQLLYNLIHKLSYIYDDIHFLTKHHKNTPFGNKGADTEEGEDGEVVAIIEPSPDGEEGEPGEAELAAQEEFELAKEDWWFKLGIYYGTLVYLILYPDDSYEGYSYTENIENEEFNRAV